VLEEFGADRPFSYFSAFAGGLAKRGQRIYGGSNIQNGNA